MTILEMQFNFCFNIKDGHLKWDRFYKAMPYSSRRNVNFPLYKFTCYFLVYPCVLDYLMLLFTDNGPWKPRFWLIYPILKFSTE